MDLLDAQNTTASSDSVVGTHTPGPSPRHSTQSPATHQLQQTLRNDASEQARRFNSSSPARANDGGDGASAFDANGAPTIVETAQENSDDGDGWPEGEGLAGNLAIDANDPGRGDFVTSIGALGNANGTQLDGSQNTSFGGRIVNSAAKSAASRNSGGWFNRGGMKVCSGSESSASHDTSPSFDPSDPKALADPLTEPPELSHVDNTVQRANMQVAAPFPPPLGIWEGR